MYLPPEPATIPSKTGNIWDFCLCVLFWQFECVCLDTKETDIYSTSNCNVFVVRNKHTGQLFCCKEQKVSRTHLGQNLLEEASKLCKIKSPLVVQYIESYMNANDSVYMVIEYCPKGDVKDEMIKRFSERRRFTEDVCCRTICVYFLVTILLL